MATYRQAAEGYRELYRTTGETSLERAAETLGLDSYKQISDGIEQDRRRRDDYLRPKISKVGLRRCAISFGYRRYQDDAGEWQLEYVSCIDLDRDGIRYVLRDHGATPQAADDRVARRLNDFDLRCPIGEHPPVIYTHSVSHPIAHERDRDQALVVRGLSNAKAQVDAVKQLWAVLAPEHDQPLSISLPPNPSRDLADLIRNARRLMDVDDRLVLGRMTRYPQGASYDGIDELAGPDELRLDVLVSKADYGGEISLDGVALGLGIRDAVMWSPHGVRLTVSPVHKGELLLATFTA